jgi:tRNA(Ile)-lysidine synthase
MLSSLRDNCRSLQLEECRVLVGVSGGPDSVALLIGLAELRAELKLELFAAHIHHGWRGIEADADAEFAAELGRRFSIPTDVFHITPERKAAHAGKSVEEAARDARYELLTEAATRTGCTAIAVGHTADDQVETVLHHILRGTGLAGLAGMPAERRLTESICLVRPLLAVTRSDILQFLVERNQPYRTDATNAESALTRNRLRIELLPLLRSQFNPQVDAALLRLAQQAAEATTTLNSLAEQILADVLLDETETVCRIDARKLAQQPEPLIRQTLRQLWIRRNWPRQEMGQREWQRLTQLVMGPGAIDLPGGVSARRESGPLVLCRR